MRTISLLTIWLACVVGAVLTLLRMLWCSLASPARALSIATALDRAANAAGNGNPRETVSSRADRARSEGRRWGCILCRLLDWIDPNHCRNSSGT